MIPIYGFIHVLFWWIPCFKAAFDIQWHWHLANIFLTSFNSTFCFIFRLTRSLIMWCIAFPTSHKNSTLFPVLIFLINDASRYDKLLWKLNWVFGHGKNWPICSIMLKHDVKMSANFLYVLITCMWQWLGPENTIRYALPILWMTMTTIRHVSI